MSSPRFKFVNRNGDERIELDASGNALKKYGGSETAWPTYSQVQLCHQNHQTQVDQQKSLDQAQANITAFFANNP